MIHHLNARRCLGNQHKEANHTPYTFGGDPETSCFKYKGMQEALGLTSVSK